MSDLSVDAEVRKLRAGRLEVQAQVKKLRELSRILGVVLVVAMVAFIASLYGKVTSMYAPQNFEEPLQEEVMNLLPQVETEMWTLWEETAPVYSELALAKFQAALPELQRAGEREVELLLVALKANAEDRLRQSMGRIYTTHRQRLGEHFPQLSTAEGTEDWGMRLMETVEADFEVILSHFQDRYLEDLGALEATLEQFMPSQYDAMEPEQLTRQFFHLWLLKVDRFVLLAEEGDALSSEGRARNDG